MKISKLFHWLYAIVLLLPVFAIGGKMLYVAFNQNAKDSYTGSYTFLTKEDVYTYLSDSQATISEDNTIANITMTKLTNKGFSGEWYSVNYSNWTAFDYYGYVVINASNININNTLYTNAKSLVICANSQYVYVNLFDIEFDFNNFTLYIYRNDGTDTRYINANAETMGNKIGGTIYIKDYNNFLPLQISFDNNSNFIYYKTSMKPTIFFEKDIFYYDTTLSSAFYSAFEEINTAPIFSWAQDSFLVEPIAYVSELFGLSNTSPLITLLSYWLNMSIIWLCFDIIMYVPLMAHRWLDKGAIE